MRKLAYLATVFAVLALASVASAQQGDAILGFGTLMSPGADPCRLSSSNGLFVVCPEKGGLYTNIGGDVIFHKRIGFGFDADWRASQGNFGGIGQPYRPILFDFDGSVSAAPGQEGWVGLDGGHWLADHSLLSSVPHQRFHLAPITSAPTISWSTLEPASGTTCGGMYSSAPKCATTT